MDAFRRSSDGFRAWRTIPRPRKLECVIPSDIAQALVVTVTEDFIYEGTHSEVKGMPYSFRMPDPFNLEATKQFLAVNHVRYAQHLGTNLGKYFTATFTDEPSLMSNWWRRMPYLVLPSSETLSSVYQAQTKRTLLDDIPLLVWDAPQAPRTRVDFWSCVANSYINHFFKPISFWCRAHGFLSGGHLMGEESFNFHVSDYGNFFQALCALDAPSMDALTALPEKISPQAALFVGRARDLQNAPFAMSECSNHYEKQKKTFNQVTEEDIRGTFNVLIACGINTFTSYFNWSEFPPEVRTNLNNYLARTLSIFGGGCSATRVALLYPAEEMMARYIPTSRVWEEKNLPIKNFQNEFDSVFNTLFDAAIPFVVIDSSHLAQGTLSNQSLQVKNFQINHVIALGESSLLTQDALNQMEELKKIHPFLWMPRVLITSNKSSVHQLSSCRWIRHYGCHIEWLKDRMSILSSIFHAKVGQENSCFKSHSHSGGR